MSALKELFAASTRRSGCPVCGEKNAAAVSVRITELGSNGGVQAGGKSTGKMKSFCAVHAVETYRRLSASLTESS